MKPTSKLFERPYLENPVYRVEIAESIYFIQRENNGSFDLWFEVLKAENGIWEHKGKFIGFTKDEALKHLDFITK